jgi:glutathione S-transferase
LDAIEEIGSALGPTMREQDEQKRLAMRQALATTTLPTWFSMLDKHLANLGATFCVGSTLTIADLKVRAHQLLFLLVVVVFYGCEIQIWSA